MKKIISVLLAMLMLVSVVSFAACTEPGTGDPEETTPDGDPVESVEFEDVNEIVYATQNVNVRSSTSTEADNKVGQVKAGTELKRIGYHSEWSKVLYNGEACYIKSEYLTTEEDEATTPPPTASNEEFTDVNNETVYVYSDQDDDGKCDNRCNEAGQNVATAYLYPSPVRENSKYVLECGTELVRTGILIENTEKGYGWSRVIYNGETLYIRNSCVTTTKPHGGATAATTTAADNSATTTTAQ